MIGIKMGKIKKVVKDVEDDVVVGGVPAKKIRSLEDV